MRANPQVTGNIGLYYVCYQLSLRGWNVLPTARNARGIDIVAYDFLGKEFVGIQVKSLSKRYPVPLGTSLEKIMGDFWVVVNNLRTSPNAYIMLPEEVKDLAARSEKNGKITYWLQPTAYDTRQFKESWDRIQILDQ